MKVQIGGEGPLLDGEIGCRSERGVRGNALVWARRKCMDRERWRSICRGHPLEASELLVDYFIRYH